MRVPDDIRKTVVFIGYSDPSGREFTCIGTGFLVGHESRAHLVTVKHIALSLGDDPFFIRINKQGGGADLLYIEGTKDRQMRWVFHPDPDVDLAVEPLHFDMREHGLDVLFLPSEMLLTIEGFRQYKVGIGDFTYTVGLFRLLSGQSRNLPIVHTGHIAMLPVDERVPVEDWEDESKRRWVEAYLVESQCLQGLSGSPVFARPSLDIQVVSHDQKQHGVRGSYQNLLLLGIWQGAWMARPDEVAAVSMGKNITVPVGMGVVVPASKLMEVLELPELKEQRRLDREKRQREQAASLTSALPASDGNPTHQEDFSRLLGLAARTPPQDD